VAQKDWDWKQKFDLAEIATDMIRNITAV